MACVLSTESINLLLSRFPEAEERRAERLYASQTGTMYRFSDSTHDHIAAAKTFDRLKLHAFSIRAFQAAVEFRIPLRHGTTLACPF